MTFSILVFYLHRYHSQTKYIENADTLTGLVFKASDDGVSALLLAHVYV